MLCVGIHLDDSTTACPKATESYATVPSAPQRDHSPCSDRRGTVHGLRHVRAYTSWYDHFHFELFSSCHFQWLKLDGSKYLLVLEETKAVRESQDPLGP